MKPISILILAIALLAAIPADACTSAIALGRATKDGRPLLWKHRDTGEENNKVERIAATNGRMAYVGLFNASDTKCKEAWMGHNEAGFAIMNTASYNIKDDRVPDRDMDREGFLMTEALGVCRTVDDFERLLKDHKKPLGVEANFGVIDAEGHGAYFEVNNQRYVRFDVDSTADGVMVRTNYSHSGRRDQGYGYIREANALAQLAPHILARDIVPATFTEGLSRTFYNTLLQADASTLGLEWLPDADFIPRRISTASCVIEGIRPGENPATTTMWVALGYPPCAELRHVTTAPDGVPAELRGTAEKGHSPLCDETVARKHEVFAIRRGSGQNYLHYSLLYNREGTGYAEHFRRLNLAYYEKHRRP